MECISIEGGQTLVGEVEIQGSKNATLPILAAAVLVRGKTVLTGCPRISDILHMVKLLRSIGCEIVWQENTLMIDASKIQEISFPKEDVDCMRSSIVLLGAMLARMGEVKLHYPGGCVIGERPIDVHLWAMKQLGISFLEEEKALHAKCDGVKGATITLPICSVGATENLILVSVFADGEVTIENAAKEPEIVELCNFLNHAGACVSGHGTDCIKIKGVLDLMETEYHVTTDRIVAGTYMLACVGCRGDVLLKKAPVSQMESVITLCRLLGAKVIVDADRDMIQVKAENTIQSIPFIETEVYPGFPTDLQSSLLAVLSKADGNSIVAERIFENRFRIVEELNRMGADIRKDNDRVFICGVDALYGRNVHASELRGGAALITAGLMAKGRTILSGMEYIKRGYEDVLRDFRKLGAKIDWMNNEK